MGLLDGIDYAHVVADSDEYVEKELIVPVEELYLNELFKGRYVGIEQLRHDLQEHYKHEEASHHLIYEKYDTRNPHL